MGISSPPEMPKLMPRNHQKPAHRFSRLNHQMTAQMSTEIPMEMLRATTRRRWMRHRSTAGAGLTSTG
jgi:hypothetical protein